MSGATISFTPFTDTRYVFANREAANAFFQAITVPLAMDSSPGVLASKLDKVTYTYSAPADTHIIIPYPDGSGGTVNLDVCSYAQYALLKAEFEALNTAFQALLSGLVAKSAMKSA
jgi:hypothetical protein